MTVWTGKPPWHRTRHPGLLNLSHPSMGRQNWVPSESRGIIRHIAWYTVVLQCGADVWLKNYFNGDQRQRTGTSSALYIGACLQRYTNPHLLYFILLCTGHQSFQICLPPQRELARYCFWLLVFVAMLWCLEPSLWNFQNTVPVALDHTFKFAKWQHPAVWHGARLSLLATTFLVLFHLF